ncbi:Mammalian cell entry related domain protein [Thioalkalivibrio sp. K90mix]|uniref:MlaD family protein n=1 Tax=unclassified Thioalkalivibrio TaxID=2621013 RepID=UPI000195AA48|nr:MULTISPECIES: MlaD family protein [unclassified Thioalkalivibrio]ADC71828.1 Mammalian cell entry related domain protein [Thioalkalivibrio sp. K90mix]
MSARQHFRLGLFIVGGLVALVTALFIMTAGNIFRASIPIETYIDSSVQGLEIGAPVKFRGVTIGEITNLGFTSVEYQQDVDPRERKRYVMVEARLWPDRFAASAREQDFEADVLKNLVDAGLRVRIAAQGITGMNYLEADFSDPDEHPPLEHDWEPRSIYIPSSPSIAVQFMEYAENLLKRIDGLDIEGVIENLNSLLVTVDDTVSSLDTGGLNQRADDLISELEQTMRTADRVMQSVEALVEHPDTQALPSETRKAIQELRRTAEAADVAGLVDRMDSMVERLDRGMDVSESKLLETLDELQGAISGLRSLSDDVRRNPGGALFGAPPPRSRMDEE